MNYGEIKFHDIANGSGIRVTLFVSGCTHHCKGCFQPETWDFNYGKPFDSVAENMIFQAIDHDFISGLTLLGGEPFEPQNSSTLYALVQNVKKRFPDKSIWCYSGYRLDQILADTMGGNPYTESLLSSIDVLVDGEFIESRKMLTLKYRGSSNQRIIDVPKSLESGKAILWADPNPR